MTKAICTPTATREEFESILRELDDVGVKWAGGREPSGGCEFYRIGAYLHYGESAGNMLTYGAKYDSTPVLPRAEFISAIKRDFAPKIDCSYPTEIKEKPKMNCNKMTKAELIHKLKFENACNDELRSNYGILKDENELHRVELGRLQGQNRKCFEQITSLKKANAEQAETIAMNECSLRNAQLENKNLKDNLAGERRALKKMTAKLEEQTASISKFFADVLEGK